MSVIWRKILRITGLMCLILISHGVGYASGKIIVRGQVSNSLNLPIPGATILAYVDDSLIAGTSTDIHGRYRINIPRILSDSIMLSVSSIGYNRITKPVSLMNQDSIHFHLTEKSVALGSVRVSGERRHSFTEGVITRNEIAKKVRYSIVPTNPISTIHQPEVIRAGSQHSSKLRIYGTSPSYYLNDISIGQDPNHYGIFSIIPGTVIDNMRFYPYGTPAQYGQSAILEFNTPKRFEKHKNGQVQASLIEVTGMGSIGNDRSFAIGTIRKSVLDKIIDRLDVHSDKRTIPPTNFQDIFVSAGYQLTPSLYLISDQFHSRDYLSYHTNPTRQNPYGVSTFQHSRENYLSVRLEGFHHQTSFSIRTAGSILAETYTAHSGVLETRGGLHVDLSAYQRQQYVSADVKTQFGKTQVTFGQHLHYIPQRMIDMKQTNWNFLPPDATSDNPYIFQKILNRQYDRYYNWDNELNSSGFVSAKRKFGNVTSESGLRVEYFGNLKTHVYPTIRQSLSISLPRNKQIKLFAGTFAENPAGRILDEYQVLIYANLHNLTPIRTTMFSLRYIKKAVTFSLFSKSIRQVPIMLSECAEPTKDITDNNNVVTIQSSGKRHFYGANVTFRAERLMSGALDISGYYGYTKANEVVGEVTIPYELNSAHSTFINADYRFNNSITFGADITYRSGYRYTPVYSTQDLRPPDDIYTKSFCDNIIREENSRQFPAYFSLNIRFNYHFGNTEVFGAISNLTNRSNPIINTHDGFIYDTGILPTIGIIYSL